MTATYVGDILNFYGEGTGADNTGRVRQIYPDTTDSVSGSLTVVNDFTQFEFVTVVAEGVTYGGGSYAGIFEGWYTEAQGSGSLVSTGSTLSVTYDLQVISGSEYYANFIDP